MAKMFRVTVTCYLTVLALLGPSLCCCTPLRLLADCSLGGHAGRGIGEGRRSLDLDEECPCHQQSSHQRSPQTPSPSEDCPTCPCKDHKAIPIAFLSEGSGLASDLSLKLQPILLDVGFLAGPDRDAVQVHSRPAEENLHSPVLSPREKLRALQIMRC